MPTLPERGGGRWGEMCAFAVFVVDSLKLRKRGLRWTGLPCGLRTDSDLGVRNIRKHTFTADPMQFTSIRNVS